jgi:1-acyl-sn-glycerol-3-phosphate acyltransferase
MFSATPDDQQPENRTLVRALHTIDTLYARIYHDLTVVTSSRLPRQGPAILVCNHISALDPVLLQSVCSTRVITWMMASEYMKLPVLGRVFKILGIIPVERTGRDTGPLRTALRDLKKGRVIGIFPEGSFSTDGNLKEFQTGVALMAIKTGAAVYPAYQDGTHRDSDMVATFVNRTKAFIAFGPAVEFDRSNSSKENLELATGAIKNAVERLSVDVHRAMENDKFKPVNKLNVKNF